MIIVKKDLSFSFHNIQVKSARFYEYKQPLKVEDVKIPESLEGEQVLVKVGNWVIS